MRERLAILVIVGTSMDEHSLRSQIGMGSESDFGQIKLYDYKPDLHGIGNRSIV